MPGLILKKQEEEEEKENDDFRNPTSAIIDNEKLKRKVKLSLSHCCPTVIGRIFGNYGLQLVLPKTEQSGILTSPLNFCPCPNSEQRKLCKIRRSSNNLVKSQRKGEFGKLWCERRNSDFTRCGSY